MAIVVPTILAIFAAWACVGVWACNAGVKEVGVCLHVYLERDFLSLERIVYPTKRDRYSSHLRHKPGGLQRGGRGREEGRKQESRIGPENDWRGQKADTSDGWRERNSLEEKQKDDFSMADAYGGHGWVEGPELEDYCSRLGSVIECFEDILVGCDSGYDFFRYRHLLHSLDRVHTYLCHSPQSRENKFLPFLQLIDCAERARLQQDSCRRPNVTANVWNQILRLEVGPELCDSLNTQRSCLLENKYVSQECPGQLQEQLYSNVSAIFLATWCKLPLPPHLLPFTSASTHPTFTPMLLVLVLLQSLW